MENDPLIRNILPVTFEDHMVAAEKAAHDMRIAKASGAYCEAILVRSGFDTTDIDIPGNDLPPAVSDCITEFAEVDIPDGSGSSLRKVRVHRYEQSAELPQLCVVTFSYGVGHIVTIFNSKAGDEKKYLIMVHAAGFRPSMRASYGELADTPRGVFNALSVAATYGVPVERDMIGKSQISEPSSEMRNQLGRTASALY